MIQGFSKTAVLLISFLKTTRLYKKIAPKSFKFNDNEIISDGDSRTHKTVVNYSKNNKSKNSTCMLNIKAITNPIFLTFDAKKIFNYLK